MLMSLLDLYANIKYGLQITATQYLLNLLAKLFVVKIDITQMIVNEVDDTFS